MISIYGWWTGVAGCSKIKVIDDHLRRLMLVAHLEGSF